MVHKNAVYEDLKCEIRDNILIGSKPEKVETKSIAQLVLNSFSVYPDFVGQIDAETGEKITFAEIKDRSIRCALWLKKQGVQKNDVISISTHIQQNDIIPYLATIYVNAINNPWYHDLGAESARYFFKMCRPKIMFASDQSIDMLAQIAKEDGIECRFITYGSKPKYLSLRDLMAAQTQEEVDNFEHIEPKNPKKQLAVIFFSSGTTGTPKGTMVSYDTLGHNRMEGCLLHSGLNYLFYSPYSWITFTTIITTCIIQRSTRIVHKEFHPEETSKVIEKYKVNWLLYTPAKINQCYKENVFSRYDYSSVESIFVCGSMVSRTAMEKCQELLPHTFIANGFGMTELGGLATIQTKKRKRFDSIGFPYKGISVKVIDVDTGKCLGPNHRGELCFKLDYIMLGYLNNPEQTEKMIDNEGWVHSGDLGFYDEDGEITIIDRLKDTFFTRGHHISPSEIEEILLRHPAVANCAVVAIRNFIDVERPLAFVVKAPGAQVSENELQNLPTSYYEYYQLTGGVIFVDKIEYTSNGKKCVAKLKEMAKAYEQEI